jgi:hypothetical protein
VGCTSSGGGGGGDQDETTRPRGTRWAQEFCLIYDKWLETIDKRLAVARLQNPAIGPAAAHTTLTQVVIGARDDTTAAVGALDVAGEPNVEDGSVIAVDLTYAFQQAEAAFETALASLQSVNPNDPAILIPGAGGARRGLVTTLSVVRNQVGAALAEAHTESLAPAFAAAPACDALFTASEE